jgi:CO dehydrogenase/acetyl-CoA synthase epsilon subunit
MEFLAGNGAYRMVLFMGMRRFWLIERTLSRRIRL